MKISIENIKKLREDTAASIADCRKALEESKDYKEAIEWLRKRGIEKAGKKAERETSAGIVESYIHLNGKIGALVSVLCETDFVARTNEFKNLVHEIAMQVAAMDPKDVESLLKQEYIRDNSRKIADLVKEMISKVGENIVIKEFKRFEI